MTLEYFSQEARDAYVAACQEACRGKPIEGDPDDPENDWETVLSRVICEHLDRFYAYIESTSQVRFLTCEYLQGGLQTAMNAQDLKTFAEGRRLPRFNIWLGRPRGALQKQAISMVVQRDLWMAQTVRGRYLTEALVPPGKPGCEDGVAPEGVFNLYTRPGVTLEECEHVDLEDSEHWKMFKYVVKKIFAHGDKDIYKFIMGWSASLVQRPGYKLSSAIFFTGEEGAGKSSLIEMLSKIIGASYCASPKIVDITGDTPVLLTKKILVTIQEESFGKANAAQIGRLRTLVTETLQSIRKLYGEPKDYEIPANFAGATNFERVIATHKKARRWMIVKVLETLIRWKENQTDEWYLWLETFTTRAGLLAVAKGLYEYDISSFDDRRIPQDTEDNKDQIRQTLPPLQQWIYDEFEMFNEDDGSDFFGKGLTREELVRRCHSSAVYQNAKISKPTIAKITRELKKIFTIGEERLTKSGKRSRCVRIPGIYEAAAMFEENIGCDPLPDINWKDGGEKSEDETGYSSADSSDSSGDESDSE